jgi:hypothetical protein
VRVLGNSVLNLEHSLLRMEFAIISYSGRTISGTWSIVLAFLDGDVVPGVSSCLNMCLALLFSFKKMKFLWFYVSWQVHDHYRHYNILDESW